MANIRWTQSNRITTSREFADIQQPLDKDGYTNDYFNKLYGADKNPYIGTERDRKNKKWRISAVFGSFSREEEQFKPTKKYLLLKKKLKLAKTPQEKFSIIEQLNDIYGRAKKKVKKVN